ncbi:MAG: site-specific integrase [Pseudomonas sp.]|nr:site-specific integrase [Pseudomonas sp.]
MKLKRYQFNSLPFVSIVDEVDCPIDPYVSCYLNGPMSAKAANTRARYANELLFVIQYFSNRRIDLPERVSSGTFISHKEYMQFYDQCSLTKDADHESFGAKFTDVNDKRLRNLLAANQRGMAKVASETLQGRVRRLRDFLVWLFEQFHDLHAVDETTRKKFVRLVAQIKQDEDSLGRNRNGRVSEVGDSVIPDEVFLKLLEMVNPSSRNNPFKRSKIRNYLIVSILVQSGIRRGALAKLKISDFRFYGTYDQISIYRSGNDPTDPRAEKPNQKTKSHLATVESSLMEKVKFYVDNVRASFPRAQFHDFLLVSESDSRGTAGQPLSLKAINAVFQKLSNELEFHVHPHMLRHKWNEVFDREGERKKVDPALLEDIRKYAMGWSQKTTMSAVYNERRLAIKARELSQAHQEKVDQIK